MDAPEGKPPKIKHSIVRHSTLEDQVSTENQQSLAEQNFQSGFALLQKQPFSRTKEEAEAIFEWLLRLGNPVSCLSSNLNQIREACEFFRGRTFKAKEVISEPSTCPFHFNVVLRGTLNRVSEANIVQYNTKNKKKKCWIQDLKIKDGSSPTQVTSGKLMLDSNMIQQCEDGWLCFAEEDSEVIQIGIKDSLNIFKKYQPDLSLEPLLRAHTFFSEFTRKEVIQLVACIQVREFVACHKVYLYQDKPTHLYYLLEGEIILQPPQTTHASSTEKLPRKNLSVHQQQHLCTISSNCIFGQIEWLNGSPRSSSAVVSSASARLAQISFADFEQVIRSRGESLQSFKQWLHDNYAVVKENWRERQLQELTRFRNSNHQPADRPSKKCSDHQPHHQLPSHNEAIGRYFHDSQQIRSLIRNEQTIMEMKLRYSDSSQPEINFSNRLFYRSDFPELDTSLRRYENEEKRIKKKLQLPRI